MTILELSTIRALKAMPWTAQAARVISTDGKLLVSRCQPVKGPFEPWYWTLVDIETDKVLTCRWECPHCGRQYHRRNICEEHSKGKEGSHPPTCLALKTKNSSTSA